VKPLLGLILLLTTAAAAADSGFQLSLNYSEFTNLTPNAGDRMAVDGSGAVYFFTTTVQSNIATSAVTKLSPDGASVLWRNQLDFSAGAMAVDSNGGVYVAISKQPADTTTYVAKLGGTGTGLAWKTSIGFLAQSAPAMAADAQGHLYVAAQSTSNGITRSAGVVRVNSTGTAIDFTTQIMGTPSSIAVDQMGASYIAGSAINSQGTTIGFLARVAADGGAGYYSVFPAGMSQTVAVDASGNVALFGGFDPGVVQRLDSAGAVTLKTTIPGPVVAFALDGAGNAYVAAVTNLLYHAKKSLATCGFDPATKFSAYSELLNVIAPDGSLLQSTYLPGGNTLGSPLLAVTSDGEVVVAASAGPAFAPTQSGPFPAGGAGSIFLEKLSPATLSPHASQKTVSLTCAGSSASLATGSISPGELVTLFGSGLGPLEGVQTGGDASTPYPASAADVRVTFDGVPAPLLWVQDGQINVVAPWSLTPGNMTRVCAFWNDASTNCLALPVDPAAPAVFMADQRYAAALNQDGTYNSASNPAAPGSIVTVYATGLGAITPSQPDGSRIGLPLPVNNLTFGVQATYTIGIPFGTQVDQPFEVEYAGPAPTLVGGVSQINFRVAAYPSYGAIYLRMGSTSSPGFSIHVAGQ
jgi:uncharacterized protein (TIGR03437 family)